MTDQYVGSNHDPSSQDVDSVWLTLEERIEDEWGGKALDHAELADELINELATALQDIRRRHYDKPALLSQSSIGFEALRRVDAIRKQTP